MKLITIFSFLIFPIFFSLSQNEISDKQNIDVRIFNLDSAKNAQIRLKIQNRISKIRLSNSIFSSYSHVVTPAITTECFNVKSTVLNILSIKWREMLFDKGELEKLNQLIILGPEDQILNDLVIDLRKEFQLISSDTGIGINTKISFDGNEIINNNLKLFQANFYRFERINEICLNILN